MKEDSCVEKEECSRCGKVLIDYQDGFSWPHKGQFYDQVVCSKCNDELIEEYYNMCPSPKVKAD